MILHMYIHVCVCIYMCTYTYMYIFVHVCMLIYIYVTFGSLKQILVTVSFFLHNSYHIYHLFPASYTITIYYNILQN
jgi:hypothetical protein